MNVVEKNISPAINIRVFIEDFIKDFVIKKGRNYGGSKITISKSPALTVNLAV